MSLDDTSFLLGLLAGLFLGAWTWAGFEWAVDRALRRWWKR